MLNGEQNLWTALGEKWWGEGVDDLFNICSQEQELEEMQI